MEFEDFIKRGVVRRGEKDNALAKSIIKTSHHDLKYLNTLGINELSARTLMCNYYDVLRAFIESISALDGFKVYSHEAYTYYLKEVKNEEQLSLKFDRFRKIRNKLTYYGKSISAEEAAPNIEEIKSVIKQLKKKYIQI